MDWPTLFGLAGVPLSLGLTMTATSPGEFKFVKVCLWAPALALIVNYGYLIWADEETINLRGVALAAVLGGIVCGMLAYALDWVKSRELSISEKSVEKTESTELFGLSNVQLRAKTLEMVRSLRKKESNREYPIANYIYTIGIENEAEQQKRWLAQIEARAFSV